LYLSNPQPTINTKRVKNDESAVKHETRKVNDKWRNERKREMSNTIRIEIIMFKKQNKNKPYLIFQCLYLLNSTKK